MIKLGGGGSKIGGPKWENVIGMALDISFIHNQINIVYNGAPFGIGREVLVQ